jgi:hypothetical protein
MRKKGKIPDAAGLEIEPWIDTKYLSDFVNA